MEPEIKQQVDKAKQFNARDLQKQGLDVNIRQALGMGIAFSISRNEDLELISNIFYMIRT